MTRTSLLFSIAAAAALAGCNSSDHTIVTGGPDDDRDANAAASAPVELPPSIMASKIYRCADNAVVYVDWLSDNKSANIRTEKGGSPTQVTAAEPGQPMTAEGGFELSGSPSSGTARITVPGRSAQNCKG